MPASEDPWWSSAVFYQVYPRSFSDGNDDGTGDLIGLRQKLGHLVDLGVDALWLSPFYRSPMADGGYDVADPCDVDPLFGTLADFDAMLADAHDRGLRVTVDVVPNHLSSEHPWFRDALAAEPGSPERARFIFRTGHGDEPPNNWPSSFGGPAWTRVPDRPAGVDQWYLHLFAPEQPDLDWTNPDVPDEFERVFRFWLDRGVDGFRIDVAHGMAKPDGLPDMTPALLTALVDGTALPAGATDMRWDNDAVHEIHRRFRRVLNSYAGDRMAVGETWGVKESHLANYVRPDELNLTFNFELLEAKWGASTFRAAIEDSMAALRQVGAPCTWVLGNHDVDRPVRRYGGGEVGVRRARAAALVQFSLPGVVYLYNGDELALDNVDLPDSALQDPTWERSGHTIRGRDGERVPLPWSGEAPPYGFSATDVDTWLPMPKGWADVTAEAEQRRDDSTYELIRTAIRLRKTLGLGTGEFGWLARDADVLHYRCGPLTVLLNTGSVPVPLPAGEVVLSSEAVVSEVPPDTAVWVQG